MAYIARYVRGVEHAQEDLERNYSFRNSYDGMYATREEALNSAQAELITLEGEAPEDYLVEFESDGSWLPQGTYYGFALEGLCGFNYEGDGTEDAKEARQLLMDYGAFIDGLYEPSVWPIVAIYEGDYVGMSPEGDDLYRARRLVQVYNLQENKSLM